MNPPVPATMRHIHIESPGGPEEMQLIDGPVPVPAAGEVLISVQAAGVNRPDVQQRKGAYPPPPGASPVLGLEAAGIVAAIGAEVTRWRPGDKVTALCNGGGYAEFVAVPDGQCLPWPEGFSAVQAAALPETFFTVWANVFVAGGLAAGGSLLVHGGSSGIGVAAIQLAVALGASVFATAGNAEKCAVIERLGAVAINYREADFAEVIKTRTRGRGVDVVLDMVGAPYARRNIEVLAFGGRLVMIAFLQGSVVESFDLLPVMMKRLTITGSTMRRRDAAEKAAIASALLEHAWPLLAARRVVPLIDSVFALRDAARAHERMESSRHIGKIMLRVAD